MCVFSKERGKKVGHSEAPKRPCFPGCPLRGFQPSGSDPQATDKRHINYCNINFSAALRPRVCPRDNLGLSLGQLGFHCKQKGENLGTVNKREKTWVCLKDKLGLSLGRTRGRPKANSTKKLMFMCLFLA